MFDGVNVAVVPLYVTVPVTGDCGAPTSVGRVTWKLAIVIVPAFIGSLNAAVIAEFIATPIALFPGLVDKITGGVVSGASPVLKLQV